MMGGRAAAVVVVVLFVVVVVDLGLAVVERLRLLSSDLGLAVVVLLAALSLSLLPLPWKLVEAYPSDMMGIRMRFWIAGCCCSATVSSGSKFSGGDGSKSGCSGSW